jgi:hypothetical protein
MTPRQAQGKRAPVFGPPSFGSLAAVDPVKLMLLPPAMQGEGVRLMLERGATHYQVARHLGLSGRDVFNMAAYAAPFHRGGEVIQKEEG